MKTRSNRVALSLFLIAGSLSSIAAKHAESNRDRRIVDTAEAGNTESEWNHGYVGDGAETGMFDGKSYRRARGYMRYAMKTFDDTPVTVSCTFVGVDNVPHTYDVVVEDSVIATRTMHVAAGANTVEIPVPIAVTKGKTNIAIILRARDGTTPALREIRTVQDHNELQ